MTINQFNDIYKRHWWTVFNFAKIKTTSLADWYYAEEITSMVFIDLWRSQPEFTKESSLKAWLYNTAIHRIRDIIKPKRFKMTDRLVYDPIELSVEDFKDIERMEIENEVISFVLEAIKSYSERERQVFDLHFIKGLSAGKIAQLLKTKPQTVSNQLVTIKRKIRADIKKPGHYPG